MKRAGSAARPKAPIAQPCEVSAALPAGRSSIAITTLLRLHATSCTTPSQRPSDKLQLLDSLDARGGASSRGHGAAGDTSVVVTSASWRGYRLTTVVRSTLYLRLHDSLHDLFRAVFLHRRDKTTRAALRLQWPDNSIHLVGKSMTSACAFHGDCPRANLNCWILGIKGEFRRQKVTEAPGPWRWNRG